jgi:hypothetical protein
MDYIDCVQYETEMITEMETRLQGYGDQSTCKMHRQEMNTLGSPIFTVLGERRYKLHSKMLYTE